MRRGSSLRLLRRCSLRHGVRERRGNVVGLAILTVGTAVDSALLDGCETAAGSMDKT